MTYRISFLCFFQVFLVGILINQAINGILKDWVFMEGRPDRTLGDGFGMPSSHAQNITFFATFVIGILIWRR